TPALRRAGLPGGMGTASLGARRIGFGGSGEGVERDFDSATPVLAGDQFRPRSPGLRGGSARVAPIPAAGITLWAGPRGRQLRSGAGGRAGALWGAGGGRQRPLG